MNGWHWRWIAVCGVAELAGLAAAALWWVGIDQLAPDPATLAMQLLALAAKSLAGVIEGTVLGFGQARLLRQRFGNLPTGNWIAATAAVAVVGWAIGSAFSVFSGPQVPETPAPEMPAGLIALFAGIFGIVAGLMFGWSQFLVLRTVTRRASLWIVANAAGWGLALPIIYLAASQGDPQAPFANALAYGLGAGMLAGLAIGCATAIAAARMPPHAP